MDDPRDLPRQQVMASYADAGVDIAAGEEAVARIKEIVRSTYGPGVIGDLGGFGGMFALGHYRDPVLVASADGVGTKILVALQASRLSTVGIDLVAMCVDDLVCQGAEPLFVLDYVVTGRLEPGQMADLVSGVAEGCRRARCALLGGEMAEHPGAMDSRALDLAGFAVGVVERDAIIGPERVRPGDVLVGLRSPGLRSNGYSLARAVLLEAAGRDVDSPAWPGTSRTLGEELLEPSVIYAPSIVELARAVDLHAAAHITGGGIPGNLRRVLPGDADAVVRTGRWEEPPIFSEIRRAGPVTDAEMARVFNLGIGMIVAVAPGDAEAALAVLDRHGHSPAQVGEVVPGRGEVLLV